jgi:hypothetical protein
MTISDELLFVAHRERPRTTDDGDIVIAVVRLARSGRTWFITAVDETVNGVQVVGFESGCIHSPERWFRVSVDFFEIAARANADEVLVRALPEPIPLALMEDMSI